MTKLADIIILAGGFGTRMKTKFSKTPKALVKINKVPIIEHLIFQCKENNFTDILISVHHQKEKIINYLGDGKKFGVNISYNYETNPAGTGGAVSLGLHLLKKNFIVLYADVFSVVNLKNLWSFHIKNKNDITAVVHPNDHPYDSDLIYYDDQLNIKKIYSKIENKNQYLKNSVLAAMYCMNKKVFHHKIKQKKYDIGKFLIPNLILNNFKVKAYPTVEYLKDMGTPERYKNVQRAVKNGIVDSRSVKNKRQAIIMDRDGTINFENGFVKSTKDFTIIKNSAKAINKINNSKFLSICATNQPVIARGDCSIEVLQSIHDKLDYELSKFGAYLDDLIYCPHHPDKGFPGENLKYKSYCNCRKPKNGMLEKLVFKHNLKRSKSFVIGDRFSDIAAAEKSKMHSILILEGAIDKQYKMATRPTHISQNLYEAVKWILNSYGNIILKLDNNIGLIHSKNNLVILESKNYLLSLSAAKLIQQHYFPNIKILDFFFEFFNEKKSVSLNVWINYSKIQTRKSLENLKKLLINIQKSKTSLILPIEKKKNTIKISNKNIIKIDLDIR